MPELLQSQRNQLLAAVQAAGFSPDQFSWTTEAAEWLGYSDDVPALKRAGTAFFFAIGLAPPLEYRGSPKATFQGEFGPLAIRCSPGAETVFDQAFRLSWPTVAELFNRWLGYVRREEADGDLWAAIGEAARGLADQTRSNERFSPDQIRAIRETLGQLRDDAVAAYQLSPPQIERMTGDIAYLVDAARESGRRDWGLMLLGTILSWLAGAVIPASAAAQMVQKVVAVLHWLAGLVYHLPP